jgi:CMP-N-acetylneuraminic acid synthetase
VLSTDDAEIAELAKSSGVEVPFLRPDYLATDSAALSDVIQHALDWLRTEENYSPDAILLLQPTSPLRRAQHIDESISLYQREAADTLISLSTPQEHPWDMVYFEGGEMKFALDKSIELTNRQTYRQFKYINGAIYITRVDLFTKYQNFWSGKIVPYHMDTLDSIDIDSEADLTIAGCLLKLRRSNSQ